MSAGLRSVDGEVWQHLAEHLLPRYATTTIALLVCVVVLASIWGVGSAWLVSVYDFPVRRVLAWGVVLPFTVPSYLAAYAYVDFFQATGPAFTWLEQLFGDVSTLARTFNIRSFPTAVVVLAAALTPYVYLACLACLKRQTPNLVDAARTLGRSQLGAFLGVGLPLLRPAIAGGGLLVALEVLNDFGTVDHFALDTMATGLYRVWYGYGDRALASQFAFIFLVIVGLVIGGERLLRGGARYWPTRSPSHPVRRVRLHGIKAVATVLFCAAPLTIGFIGPVAILTWHALSIEIGVELMNTLPMIGRSVFLGLVVSSLAVIVGFLLTTTTKQGSAKWLDRLPRFVATLGYAIPGGLIAVGVLLALPLTVGMLPLLIYALLIRFVAIPTQTLEAAQAQMTPTMTMAARTLGASPWRTFRKIHLRLLGPGALGAALLVFIDTVKELPVAMILRPFDFELLPIRVHNLASDERLEAATVGAALLILISIPPVIWLHGRMVNDAR